MSVKYKTSLQLFIIQIVIIVFCVLYLIWKIHSDVFKNNESYIHSVISISYVIFFIFLFFNYSSIEIYDDNITVKKFFRRTNIIKINTIINIVVEKKIVKILYESEKNHLECITNVTFYLHNKKTISKMKEDFENINKNLTNASSGQS